ncbi:MAG: nucleotidyltransferase domain-containing protein [Methanosarcinales archaeon Met12]|nr:MAG: nucleotidyltransferase domain-containing protein [Methanosarcinales archaeon Met12]
MNSDATKVGIGIFMEKKAIIKRIEQVLSGLEVDLGYVFGSFLVSDDFRDVDVAVLTPEKLGPYERFRFPIQVARKLEDEIKPKHEFDVKILDSSPIDFQYNVISSSELVFCKDEYGRIGYEEAAMREYLDYMETSMWLDERFLAEA